MRTLLMVAAAGAILSGCADYYGPGPSYGPGPVGVASFDGYYDGFYGPVYDGYYGTDGAFYYRGRHDHDWRRDTGEHFHAQAANGFHPFHGAGRFQGHAAGGHAAAHH
jgi:hypothetical protein